MLRLPGFLIVLALTATACTSAPLPSPSPAPTGAPTAAATALTATPTVAPEPSPSDPPLGIREIGPAELTQTGGCGDVFIWATNAEGTMGITIEWEGAARNAWAADGFEETAELPQAPVTVSLVAGQGLSRLYCNDVLEPGMSEDSRVPARSGSVELTVRPDAGGFEPASHADVTLRDVQFNLTFGTEEETWILDELVIQNVFVGWFAG
jgi:hypothetical protein